MTIHGQHGYTPDLDQPRLEKLLHRVRNAMIGGEWLTLAELVRRCGNSEGGVGARIRQLRNDYHYRIDLRSVAGKRGLFEYRMVIQRYDDNGNGLLPGVVA